MTEPTVLWMCLKSPTSAHHWLIDDAGRGKCKHCHESRQFLTEPAPYARRANKDMANRKVDPLEQLREYRRRAEAQLEELND